MFAPAPWRAPLVAFAAGLVTILSAWGFQVFGGYVPCKLCLLERLPYYSGLPLLLVGLVLSSRAGVASRGLYLLAAIAFFIGAGIAVYHAGAEWDFWLGPSDCGGGVAPVASANDLLGAMRHTKLVECSEATWRLFGLSFAGWNVLASGFVALLSLRGAFASRNSLI